MSADRRVSGGAAGAGLREKHWRSIAKAISWRIVGSLDTMVLAYVVMRYLFPWLGLDAGVDDSVVKPFSARELVARIKAVLRRSHGDGEDGKGKTAHDDVL